MTDYRSQADRQEYRQKRDAQDKQKDGGTEKSKIKRYKDKQTERNAQLQLNIF